MTIYNVFSNWIHEWRGNLSFSVATKLCVSVSGLSIPALDQQASQEEFTLPDVQMAHWPECGGKDETFEAEQRRRHFLKDTLYFFDIWSQWQFEIVLFSHKSWGYIITFYQISFCTVIKINQHELNSQNGWLLQNASMMTTLRQTIKRLWDTRRQVSLFCVRIIIRLKCLVTRTLHINIMVGTMDRLCLNIFSFTSWIMNLYPWQRQRRQSAVHANENPSHPFDSQTTN